MNQQSHAEPSTTGIYDRHITPPEFGTSLRHQPVEK
jgi:hypothetical protein